MKYVQHKFTLPASHKTDQMTWDLAFLSKKEFIAKYSKTAYFIMTSSQTELDEAYNGGNNQGSVVGK